MSQLQDCSHPCPTIAPVNVPGPPGLSAFSYLTAQFTGTTPNHIVTATVASTAQYGPSESVYIPGTVGTSPPVGSPGYFTIVEILGNVIGLTSVNDTSATTFNPGSPVLPSGAPGTNGTNGASGYTALTSNYNVPATGLSNATTALVASSAAFVVGGYVTGYSAGAAGPANFLITAIPNTTSLTLQFLANPGDVAPGSVLSSGSNIVPAAQIGSNAYSVTTSQTATIPAIGSSITFTMNTNAWMTVGAIVVSQGPSHWKVASLSGTTQASLTFQGYAGDVAGGTSNVVASGQVVAPSGVQPFLTNGQQSQYQGGSYTLTTSFAAVAFSAVVSQITLPTAGVWVINADVTAASVLAGTAAGTISIQLFRNNNTPMAVQTSQVLNYTAPTTVGTDIQLGMHGFVYSTITSGDIISIYAQKTVASGSGTTNNLYSTAITAFRVG